MISHDGGDTSGHCMLLKNTNEMQTSSNATVGLPNVKLGEWVTDLRQSVFGVSFEISCTKQVSIVRMIDCGVSWCPVVSLKVPSQPSHLPPDSQKTNT